MSPLQPENARDLFQRLAELQEVQDDLSSETLDQRVGAIVDRLVELVRDDPEGFADQCRHLYGEGLEQAIALSSVLQRGRSEQP